MPHHTTRTEGFVAVLATDPQRSPEVLADLKAVVARSVGGILVVLQEPTRWPGGAVIGVAPRRGPETVGPPFWLGPLSGEPAREALLNWLGEGGPGAAPLPEALARLTMRPRRPAPAPHTTN